MISEVILVLSSALLYTTCVYIIFGIKIRIKPIGLAINSRITMSKKCFYFFFRRIFYCAACGGDMSKLVSTI